MRKEEMVKKLDKRFKKKDLVEKLADVAAGEGDLKEIIDAGPYEPEIDPDYVEALEYMVEVMGGRLDKAIEEFKKLREENRQLKKQIEEKDGLLEKARGHYKKLLNAFRRLQEKYMRLSEEKALSNEIADPDITTGKLEAYHTRLIVYSNPIDIGQSEIVGKVILSMDELGLIVPNKGFSIFKDKKTGKVAAQQTRLGKDKQGRPIFALDRSGVRGDHIDKICKEIADRYVRVMEADEKERSRLKPEDSFTKVVDG